MSVYRTTTAATRQGPRVAEEAGPAGARLGTSKVAV